MIKDDCLIENAMTVDVEDYFHVSAFADEIDRLDWSNMESRVTQNTEHLLKIFSDYGINATFFVLGWVADRYPSLVRNIADEGHEVACHGYSHQLIYNQSIETFKEETQRAKGILEDIVQRPVIGYRAASYSITQKSIWALDVLAEAGFKYDSSIFPIHHDRYGMPDTPKLPYSLSTTKGNSLVEFPLSTVNIFGYRLPIAGGGYFRLYPYSLSKIALASINQYQNQPFIFYLHPWEIDPEQPRIKASALSKFRHYSNLGKCERRLRRLLADFQFNTVEKVLIDCKLLHTPMSNNEHKVTETSADYNSVADAD
jgi:polysaccharide deacetylase family protein (PEP-CTERM system associated)